MFKNLPCVIASKHELVPQKKKKNKKNRKKRNTEKHDRKYTDAANLVIFTTVENIEICSRLIPDRCVPGMREKTEERKRINK